LRSNIGTAPGGPQTPSVKPPHTPFNSPPLRRLLAGWAAEAPAGRLPAAGLGDGVAERLGQWLAWTDAVELSQVLNQPPAPVADGATGATPVSVLAQALARLQADQARQIGADPVYLPGNDAGALDAGDDLAPYRRAAQARQRSMAAAVAPLRTRLRAALAAGSPAQARLAALDATLDAALAGRERAALHSVVAQIERRARRLRAGSPPGTTDWRPRFHHDMQQALLAELDLRLQPLHGLLDALRQEAGA
jgi:hypothetical protein